MTAFALDRASSWGTLLLVLWVLAGCATVPSSREPNTASKDPVSPQVLAQCHLALTRAFPPGYEAFHRAVITHKGYEYACDGFLQVTPESGYHLALISALGQVSEVRWHPESGPQVLRVTPLMPVEWSRDYVLRDLGLLFVPPPEKPTTSWLREGRPALVTTDSNGISRQYVFSRDGRHWEGVQVERRGRPIYRARVLRRRQVGEFALPIEWRVETDEYELWIRVVAYHPVVAEARAFPDS